MKTREGFVFAAVVALLVGVASAADNPSQNTPQTAPAGAASGVTPLPVTPVETMPQPAVNGGQTTVVNGGATTPNGGTPRMAARPDGSQPLPPVPPSGATTVNGNGNATAATVAQPVNCCAPTACCGGSYVTCYPSSCYRGCGYVGNACYSGCHGRVYRPVYRSCGWRSSGYRGGYGWGGCCY